MTLHVIQASTGDLLSAKEISPALIAAWDKILPLQTLLRDSCDSIDTLPTLSLNYIFLALSVVSKSIPIDFAVAVCLYIPSLHYHVFPSLCDVFGHQPCLTHLLGF